MPGEAIFRAAADFSKLRSEAATGASALKNVKDQADAVGRGSDMSGMQTSLSGIAKSAARVGRSMTVGVTLPIVGVGVAATKTFSEFESQITKAGLKAGATTDEMAQMRDVAIEMGARTIFSAIEAAQGMDQLAAAGFSAREAIVALPGVMQAAQAANEDLGLTSRIVATSMKAFGIEAGQSAHVADVMAQAANTSALDMQKLGEGLAQAGSLGASANQSLEDVVASLAMLVNQGVPAASAGAAVRQAIGSLQAPLKKGADLMKELGIETRDANGQMLPLPDLVNNLQSSLSMSNPAMVEFARAQGLSGQAAKDQALNILFGVEGMKAMALLTGEGSAVTLDLAKDTEKLAQMQAGLNQTLGVEGAKAFMEAHTAAGVFTATGGDAIRAMSAMEGGADGVAAKFGEAFAGTVSARLENMVGSLQSLAITVVTIVLPALEGMVQWLTDAANGFAAFAEANPGVAQFAVTLGVILAAVGPLLMAFGGIASAISALMPVFAVLGPVIVSAATATWGFTAALLANPITWIVLAVIALIAAIVLLAMNWDAVVAWISGVWSGFVAWLSSTWDSIVAAVLGFGGQIMSFLSGLWDGILAAAQTAWNWLLDFLGNLVISLFFQIIGPLGTLALWIAANWDRIQAKAVEIWDAIVAFIAAIPERIKQGLAFLASLPGIVAAWFQSVWNRVVDIWNSLVSFVQSVPGRIVSALSAMAALAATVGGWILGVYNAAVAKFGDLVDWVKGVPGRIMSALGDLSSLLYKSGKALIDGFLDGIKAMWGVLTGWVKKGMEGLRSLWPFSPAKEGPFSGRGYVTYSGQAMTSDFADSLVEGAPKAVSGAARMLQSVQDVFAGGLNIGGAVALSPSQVALASPALDMAGAAVSTSTVSTVTHGDTYQLYLDGLQVGMDSKLEAAVREIVDAVDGRRRFERTENGG